VFAARKVRNAGPARVVPPGVSGTGVAQGRSRKVVASRAFKLDSSRKSLPSTLFQ
jgi:hypothetical protein